MMHPTRRVPLVMALGVCLSVTPIVLTAISPAEQRHSAPLVAPQEMPTTLHVQELKDDIVTVHVHAMVPENIKMSDSAQGTVQATVMAIDRQINQVKVQTHEGQRLVLYLAPESLAGMRVGHYIMLQVAQRSAQEVLTERSPIWKPSKRGVSHEHSWVLSRMVYAVVIKAWQD